MSYNRKEFNKVLNDRFCNISNSIKLISSYASDSPFYSPAQYDLFQQVIMYNSLCTLYQSRFKKPYNKSLLLFVKGEQKIISLYIPFKPHKK